MIHQAEPDTAWGPPDASTNPSLTAKNPEIQRLVVSGHTLTSEEENNEYRCDEEKM